ncbi:hypothetical protein CBL_00883 [Carabus blaptoides fortunei]
MTNYLEVERSSNAFHFRTAGRLELAIIHEDSSVSDLPNQPDSDEFTREQCNQSGLYCESKRRGCTQAAQPLVDQTARLNETFQVSTVDVCCTLRAPSMLSLRYKCACVWSGDKRPFPMQTGLMVYSAQGALHMSQGKREKSNGTNGSFHLPFLVIYHYVKRNLIALFLCRIPAIMGLSKNN